MRHGGSEFIPVAFDTTRVVFFDPLFAVERVELQVPAIPAGGMRYLGSRSKDVGVITMARASSDWQVLSPFVGGNVIG